MTNKSRECFEMELQKLRPRIYKPDIFLFLYPLRPLSTCKQSFYITKTDIFENALQSDLPETCGHAKLIFLYPGICEGEVTRGGMGICDSGCGSEQHSPAQSGSQCNRSR